MELKLIDLKMNYGNKEALKGISVSLTEGIYGLLGPNGAGKSTTMNIITGNLNQTEGQVLFDGEDVRKLGKDFKKRLGYMPQQQAFYPSFTVWQFMEYIAALKDISKAEVNEQIDWALNMVSLLDRKKDKIKSLSGGMKQRLLLAQAILSNPDILILDEPTAGLDPKQRIAVRNIISKIAMHKIVILSTHVVQDIEFIAKDIILLSEGQIIKMDSPSKLNKGIYGKVWEITSNESDAQAIINSQRVSNISCMGSDVIVRMISDEQPNEKAILASPTLEDVYLYHFGSKEEL